MRTRNPVQPGRRLGMPIEAWPALDRTAWNAAFAIASPLDDHPHGAELRAPTRVAIGTCYARWLVWIHANHPDTLVLPLDARAIQERVLPYLQALCGELTLRTVLGYACRLKRALELLAPKEDWCWFTPIIGRIERRARAARSASHPFVPSNQLFDYGIEAMARAEAEEIPTATVRAEDYRNGLMIAFLAARPLRLKNMIELEIGTQLIGSNGGYKVAIPGEQMKTHKSIEFPVPVRLVPYLRRYLDYHRKVLAAGPYGAAAGYREQAAYLWLARSGAQFPADTFADLISRRTTERFGIRLTLHAFRHCAATSIAENDPEEFHIIRIILGHTTLKTAERHYIHAKGIEAVQLVQNAIIKKRTASAKPSGRKSTRDCRPHRELQRQF